MVSTRTLHAGVQHNAIGIVTCYVLDNLGFGRRWWRDFTLPSKLTPRSIQPRVIESQGSFMGIKLLGHVVNHLPPSSAEVKENVELYFYSPCTCMA